jgi:nicotinate-nucleotide adenylyltransferase
MTLRDLPPFAPGLKIGLFGGSFNPPHAGHRAASLLAMKRLHLDRIWWLVSPGNPLKDTSQLPPMVERVKAAQTVAAHPRIIVTPIEAAIGTSYSYETIIYLTRRCPGVHFVWLMGADNFLNFHRWRRWRELTSLVPMAIIDRPGSTFNPLKGRASHWLASYRLNERDAKILADTKPPAFVFLHGPRSPLSSTFLRKTGKNIHS